MSNITGVGEKKMERYGEIFLGVIAGFLEKAEPRT
jgi:hypothetical protein